MASIDDTLRSLDGGIAQVVSLLQQILDASQRSLDVQRRDSVEFAASSAVGGAGIKGGGPSAGGGGAGTLTLGRKNAGRAAEFFTDPFQTTASKAFGTARALARGLSSRIVGDPSLGDVAFNVSGLAEAQRIHQSATSNTRALLNRYAAAGGTVTPELVQNVFGAQRAQAERINTANQTINTSIGASGALAGGVAEMTKKLATAITKMTTGIDKLDRTMRETQKKD